MTGAVLAMMGAAASGMATPAPPAPVWAVAAKDPQRALAVGRDPLLAGGRGGRFLLGCGLFRLDARGRPRGDLARKARSREGGAVWDIKLRRGLRLADGSDLDAVAFVRLWNRQIPARREARWLTEVLAQAPMVLAADTIRFRLTGRRPQFLRRLSHPWLVLVDPGAAADDASSLGPFRRVPPAAGSPASGEVLLTSRADHFHGVALPGDLLLQDAAAVDGSRRVCAAGEKVYTLIFNEHAAPAVPVRRRLLDGLDRERLALFLDSVAKSLPAAGAGGSGEATDPVTISLILDEQDQRAVAVADQLQAALLDAGIRLRLEAVAGAELERRLRAPLYSAALVSLPPSFSEVALGMEARLAAIGLHRSPWLDLLLPALGRRSGRGTPPEAAAIGTALQEAYLVIELGAADECHMLPAGVAASALLPWLTPTPAGRFRRAGREEEP